MNDKIIGRNPVLEAIRSGRSVDKILVKKGKYEGSIVPIIKIIRIAKIIGSANSSSNFTGTGRLSE